MPSVSFSLENSDFNFQIKNNHSNIHKEAHSTSENVIEKQHVAITPDFVGEEEEITEAEIVKNSNFVNQLIMPIEPIVKTKNEYPKLIVKLNVNERPKT